VTVEIERPGAHQPRDAFELLSRRVTVAVVLVLLAASLAAWLRTVQTAGSMREMVTGLGQVGERMPNDMTAPAFMVMWVAMMVAMMLPTVGPIVLSHRAVVQRRGEGARPTVAFVAGYLIVWTTAGIVPLAALLGFRDLSMQAASTRWLPVLAGGVLVVAGVYQFTGWKAVCLRACRSPMTFVLTHDWGGGARSALRAGVSHGGFCLGCCWALMSVLVVVGLMNLVWMALLSLVFLGEKNWRYGVGLTRVAGSTLIVLGAAVALWPSILPSLAGT
jgi:predicted metal-binding membrane protein